MDAQNPLMLLVFDDVAFVGLLQHREEGPRVVVDATPAHVERLFPFVAAVGNHAPAAADASVVEQKMDLVGVLTLCDFMAKPLHLRFVGHIGDMRRDAQALRQPLRLAEPPRFSHRVRKDIAHRDIAAFGDQLANELSAHTRAAASHDCDPACEILHTRTSLGFRHLSMIRAVR
jgi:hypothetical protein